MAASGAPDPKAPFRARGRPAAERAVERVERRAVAEELAHLDGEPRDQPACLLGIALQQGEIRGRRLDVRHEHAVPHAA